MLWGAFRLGKAQRLGVCLDRLGGNAVERYQAREGAATAQCHVYLPRHKAILEIYGDSVEGQTLAFVHRNRPRQAQRILGELPRRIRLNALALDGITGVFPGFLLHRNHPFALIEAHPNGLGVYLFYDTEASVGVAVPIIFCFIAKHHHPCAFLEFE